MYIRKRDILQLLKANCAESPDTGSDKQWWGAENSLVRKGTGVEGERLSGWRNSMSRTSEVSKLVQGVWVGPEGLLRGLCQAVTTKAGEDQNREGHQCVH